MSIERSAIGEGACAVGDLVELEIQDLAYGGAGVGRVNGLTVFVRGAVPGDRARVRIVHRKPNYAEAEVAELLAESTERVVPRCAHFGVCGGCQLMSLPYAKQTEYKAHQVEEALRRLGKLGGYREHPLTPSPEAFGYRNRMEFAFAEGPAGLISGLHRGDDPGRVEAIGECHLQDPLANEIRHWVTEALQKEACTSVFVRRLTLRRCASRGNYLIVLTTREDAFPEGPALARGLMKQFPAVSGVTRRIVDADGGELSVRKLAGFPEIEQRLCGLTLMSTSGAFLQVNTAQAERLYQTVERFAGVRARDRLLDIYSGVGAITLLLGRSAGEATGIESSSESVRCARKNAEINRQPNVSFLEGDAGRLGSRMAASGEKYDVIILNPPRAGLPAILVDASAKLSPFRIVYVSCNPATLARDLARYARTGYRTTDVAPFDMFPQTYHVEIVARLERPKA